MTQTLVKPLQGRRRVVSQVYMPVRFHAKCLVRMDVEATELISFAPRDQDTMSLWQSRHFLLVVLLVGIVVWNRCTGGQIAFFAGNSVGVFLAAGARL